MYFCWFLMQMENLKGLFGYLRYTTKAHARILTWKLGHSVWDSLVFYPRTIFLQKLQAWTFTLLISKTQEKTSAFKISKKV